MNDSERKEVNSIYILQLDSYDKNNDIGRWS